MPIPATMRCCDGTDTTTVQINAIDCVGTYRGRPCKLL
jgi:hypothetical protein